MKVIAANSASTWWKDLLQLTALYMLAGLGFVPAAVWETIRPMSSKAVVGLGLAGCFLLSRLLWLAGERMFGIRR